MVYTYIHIDMCFVCILWTSSVCLRVKTLLYVCILHFLSFELLKRPLCVCVCREIKMVLNFENGVFGARISVIVTRGDQGVAELFYYTDPFEEFA